MEPNFYIHVVVLSYQGKAFDRVTCDFLFKTFEAFEIDINISDWEPQKRCQQEGNIYVVQENHHSQQ